MSYTLPELPYFHDALEPYIDARTMEIHHGMHHKTYVDKLNSALQDHAELSKLPVEQLVRNLNEIPEEIRTAVRNHGGGHLNHSFFWPILKKDVEPSGPIVEAISKQFGSLDVFKQRFSENAALLFGSGWAWLTYDQGELAILTTPNQDNPISQGKLPLLGLDVWEHAYYLKYQNRRPDYISAFFHIINWEKINEHFETAQS